MITEEEAFWSGIAVATLMLGGGFSMLFLRTLTGEGAVVLALGLMTMALTIQMRARPRHYVDSWSPMEARAMTPIPPAESSTQPEQTQTETQNEAQTEQPSQPQEDATEPAQPAQQPQPQPAEQPQTPPETPVEEKKEPQAPEAPKEEPIVVF